MKMEKRKFRIGELARQLSIEKFVVRFWEKEFNLESDRSEGGQRFYTEQDLQQFKLIKKLLYEEGFTIAGAKKHMKKGTKEFKVVASTKTTDLKAPEFDDTLINQMKNIKTQLLKLKKLL